MWTIASTTAVITSMFGDVGTVLAQVIGAVLAVAVALVGLGFAYRKVKKYITGGKF